MEGTLIPAYYYNQDLWEETARAPIGDKTYFVIVNPASGPGTITDPNYTNFISRLIEEGKTPIGYIHTQWGSRDLEEVKEEVDRWMELYPNIQGFFIDKASTSSSAFNYYSSLVDYIQEKGDFSIVLNPGTMPSPEYFEIADAVVIFENSFSNLNYLLTPPEREKSACIVYNVPAEAWDNTFEEIRDRCGYIYLTDDNLPNPYDSLPSYFGSEMRKIAYDLPFRR
jgi:hypothetical protein